MARTAAVGAPLRHPAFGRLWLGLSISYLGDQFTIIAWLCGPPAALAAAPLGAAFGGVLLQYLSAPLVIAISGLAASLPGWVASSHRHCVSCNEEAPGDPAGLSPVACAAATGDF